MTEANEMKTVFTMIRKKMATINIKNIIASGLSMSQATVIQEIGHHDGISLKMLSSLVGLDNSTVSRTVNQLVEKNLVMRQTQENDRRMILINLSKEGQNLVNRMEKQTDEQYARMIRSIPPEALEAFKQSAYLMLHAVEQYEEENKRQA